MAESYGQATTPRNCADRGFDSFGREGARPLVTCANPIASGITLYGNLQEYFVVTTIVISFFLLNYYYIYIYIYIFFF